MKREKKQGSVLVQRDGKVGQDRGRPYRNLKGLPAQNHPDLR
jgi:hypothetical protein